MEVDYRSRYRFCRLHVTDKGAYYWGTRPPIKIPASDNDTFHRVTQSEERRIDLIAHKYYGDVRLWWIIAEANDIINPISLQTGRVLRIPGMNTIQLKVLG